MNLRTNRAVLVMSAVAGALAYWRLLLWNPAIHIPVVEALMFTKGDPYPQAIFLIAAILVYRRRASVREAMQANGSLALAAPLLLAGSLFFIWGHYVDAMDLLLVSFLLVAIGASLLWCRTRFVRAMAIPWIVLAFALSAPATLANQAYYALRLWTASHAAALLPLLGYPTLLRFFRCWGIPRSDMEI
jgi:hypothetical protein